MRPLRPLAVGRRIGGDAAADAARGPPLANERASRPFELLETLRLQAGLYANEAEHLHRLAGAAAHFGYPWREGDVRDALRALAAAHPRGAWRTRLRLDDRGGVQAQAHALDEPAVPVRVQLAEAPIDEAHGEFVRFKTTHRGHYDRFAPRDAEVFDTLLWNAAREITDSRAATWRCASAGSG